MRIVAIWTRLPTLLLIVAVPLLSSATLQEVRGEGVITVSLADSGSGQPVLGAEVIIMYFENPPPNTVTRWTSDAYGRVTATGMPLGNYSIGIEGPGYNRLEGIRITLDAENPRRELEFDLTRGGTLAGRVLDVEGEAIEGVELTLLRKSFEAGRPVLVNDNRPERFFSDENGQYLFTGLEPGEYLLRADIPVLPEQRFAAGPWDDQLRRFYYPNVHDVDLATAIRVDAAVTHGGLDLRVPDVETFSISGVVVNPLPGVPFQEDGIEVRVVSTFYLVPRTAVGPDRLEPARDVPLWDLLQPGSDETPFLITGVPPGSYDLFPVFRLNGGVVRSGTARELVRQMMDDEVVTTRAEVNVVDRDIEGLRIVLQPNAIVPGRMVVAGGMDGINWSLVRVHMDPGRLLPTHGSPLTTRDDLELSQPVTADTGTFAFRGLPEGAYAVSVTGLPPEMYVADVRAGAQSINENGSLYVRSSTEVPLEVHVSRNGAVIEGSVAGPGGQIVPRAGIVLVPDAPRRGNQMLYKRMSADASGRFVFRGIAPGSYRLFAWSQLPEGQAEAYAPFLAPFESRGQGVSVEAGMVRSVNVSVIPSGF